MKCQVKKLSLFLCFANFMWLASTAASIDEDFSVGASNFTEVYNGTWNVIDGRYVLTNPGTADVGLLGNISVCNTEVTGNFELTTIVRLTGTASTWNDAAVIFNYKDSVNYYYVSLNETNDPTTHGIFKVVDNVATELSNIPTTILSDTDYELKINLTGSDIVVTIDGNQVANATDAGITAGKVGFGTKNDGAQFDNLLVTDSSSTGLAEFKKEESIRVFPNPLCAGNQLNIDLKQHEDILGIRIYDINGKIHYANPKIDKNILKVPNNFKIGMYIMKVQTLNKSEDFKFYVVH